MYISDVFKPVAVEPGDIPRLVKHPLELFKYVGNTVRNDLPSIESLEVRDVYIGKESSGVLVEYLVEYEKGRISIKLVDSEDPEKNTLQILRTRAKEKLWKVTGSDHRNAVLQVSERYFELLAT